MKRCWADVVHPASTPVPSSSQPKKQIPRLAMGPSGRGFGDFLYFRSGSPGLIPGRTNCERAWNVPGCVVNQACLYGWNNRTSLPWAKLMLSLSVGTEGRPVNMHTYIKISYLPLIFCSALPCSALENHIYTWFTKNLRLCLQKDDSQFYLHPQKTRV